MEKTAMDIGGDIAALLLAWRPDIGSDDLANALIHAVHKCSVALEGASEGRLQGFINALDRKTQEVRESI